MTIKAALFDLSGVLYTGNAALPGAQDALQKLSATGIPIRYITNTTRSPRSKIITNLTSMGFHIKEDDLFTAPSAILHYLEKKGLSPYLIIHPDLESEFADLPGNRQTPDAVVVGDAGEYFTYEKLNPALRYLLEGAPLLAMGVNRYFKENDGKEMEGFSLDMGPFVKALEYAADTQATIFGKPAKTFYHAAVDSTGCKPQETVMIGDDIQSDVIGALEADLQAILVRTGKFREVDEALLSASQYKRKAHCMEDVSVAISWVIEQIK